MGAIEDYKDRGGMIGVARTTLVKELAAAAADELHFLRPVIDAYHSDQKAEAAERLMEILRVLPDGHRLGIVKVAFYTLPAVQAVVNEMVGEILAGKEPSAEMPEMIHRWAYMEAGSKADRSSLARKAANPGVSREPKEGSLRNFRRVIVNEMKLARRESRTLKEFLKALPAHDLNQPAEMGLSLAVRDTNNCSRYTFHHDDFPEPYSEVTHSAVEKLWAEAGKQFSGK